MVIITLQRDKCIGCNYCGVCARIFRMSKKDGKSVLLKSADKKGVSFTLKHRFLMRMNYVKKQQKLVQ